MFPSTLRIPDQKVHNVGRSQHQAPPDGGGAGWTGAGNGGSAAPEGGAGGVGGRDYGEAGSESLVQLCLMLIQSPKCGQAIANYLAAHPHAVDQGLFPEVYDASNLRAQSLLNALDDIMINTDDSEGTERDVEGCTGLLVAVAAQNLDATIAFLQYGACPNIATNEGWSPLHQACWNFQHCESEADVNRNETIILALLHYGADPTSVCYLEGDYWEYSAVHLCALARHRNHCSQTIWLAICRVCGPQPLQQVAGEEAVTPYHLLQYGQPDVEAEAEEATFDSDNEAMELAEYF